MNLLTGKVKRSKAGIEIDLHDTDAACEDMKKFNSEARITTVNLTKTRVGNKGIEYLSELPYLENLYLTESNITGECLKILLKIPTLRRLSVGKCPVYDNHFYLLSNFKVLDRLIAYDTGMTDKGLLSLPQINTLNIGNTPTTVQGLLNYLEKYPQSRFLNEYRLRRARWNRKA